MTTGRINQVTISSRRGRAVFRIDNHKGSLSDVCYKIVNRVLVESTFSRSAFTTITSNSLFPISQVLGYIGLTGVKLQNPSED